MNILILEDEKPAAERLHKLLVELEPDANMPAVLVSVASAVKWLTSNPPPDLIFADINLADGSSFEVFQSLQLEIPVIFITAYDEYAMEAFRVNSVDYILKPVKKEELKRALNRFHQRKSEVQDELKRLIRQLKPSGTYLKRLIIRYGEIIKMIDLENAAYFYTENRINYVCTFDHLTFPVDQTLDELEELLNPELFFRINRQFVISVSSIDKMTSTSKSRVKLTLKPACSIETIVSTERSPLFKDWLTGLI